MRAGASLASPDLGAFPRGWVTAGREPEPAGFLPLKQAVPVLCPQSNGHPTSHPLELLEDSLPWGVQAGGGYLGVKLRSEKYMFTGEHGARREKGD